MRLERNMRANFHTQPIFQFHKGAIRTLVGAGFYTDTLKFQFHKGAIRTHLIHQSSDRLLVFQFHKGAIRTLCRGTRPCPGSNFNSIKVRLELTSHPNVFWIFAHFNSIKVRLERQWRHRPPLLLPISIP